MHNKVWGGLMVIVEPTALVLGTNTTVIVSRKLQGGGLHQMLCLLGGFLPLVTAVVALCQCSLRCATYRFIQGKAQTPVFVQHKESPLPFLFEEIHELKTRQEFL